MNPNLAHITFEQLVDWVEDRLPDELRPTIAAHLAACEHCQAEANHVARIIGAMHADTSIDAPPILISRAIRAFQQYGSVRQPSIVQRLVALLRFESTPLTPAPGLRSDAPTERQLVYTAGDYDLDLRVMPDGSNWLVSGQVFGPDVDDVQSQLSGGALQLQASFSGDEAFAFPPVPAGRYTLALVTGTAEITVDDLQLGTS